MTALLLFAALIVPVTESPLHAGYDALLRDTVEDGSVDYAALKRREAELDAYLDALAAADPEALDRDGRLALWINGYNAFTLKLILDHYPGIESIKDISRGDRWKAERWVVGGATHSLDQIEHEILRPMGEPRIHFAIVCASLSCPDLIAEAYVRERLDEQLDAVTRRFLADEFKGLQFGVDDGFFGTDYELRLSSLFDWFEEDFTRDGPLVDFVLRYAPDDAAAFIRSHRNDLDVDYLDYDWSLNGR